MKGREVILVLAGFIIGGTYFGMTLVDNYTFLIGLAILNGMGWGFFSYSLYGSFLPQRRSAKGNRYCWRSRDVIGSSRIRIWAYGDRVYARNYRESADIHEDHFVGSYHFSSLRLFATLSKAQRFKVNYLATINSSLRVKHHLRKYQPTLISKT
ncbi:MAG: hypothetical protein CM1200mP3_16500 [Chloroflexota bacterium]|nr:MAG: hypothetical protein CM1200mP3_16500 [Chloroflexota bacterium]